MMSIIAYIANIFRGELGRGKRNSSIFNLHSSLSFILSIALLFGASGAWAADWTDADGKTYTALKSINGGGNGTAAGGFIITDITPAGTEIVKFKVKTPAAVTKNGCVYCARSFTKSGNKWTVDATQFAGFRLAKKFRIDRKGTQTSLDDETCTPATEYSVSANYSTGAVTVNNLVQSQNLSTGTGNSYTPGGKLAILASYSDIAAPASPTASSSWYNCLPDDLYYLQLWNADGETLAHNFMPAVRDSDPAVGLYDTVTRKFYSAAKGSLKGAAYGASERAGKKWTGLGGDNKMSTAANWANNDKPEEGDDIDFTIAVPNAEIVADIVATFGKVYLGTGDIPKFTGALSATAINDLPKMQAYATAEDGFTFTLAAPSGQNFIWNGSAANWWAADAWDYNTAASVWYDNNTAVFKTVNATATLNANVTAESVVFSADAKIVTNGTDAATLTVPTVSVAQNVTATIAAPTSGALAKTGAGTLTLKSSRSEATTLSEGTLVFSGNDTKLDWSKLTLGTDPAKPVTLRFEDGAALASESAECIFGNVAGITSTICKSGGDWTRSGHTRIKPAAGANTTFVNESGNLIFNKEFTVGAQSAADATGSSELAIAGGKVAVSGSTGSQWVSVGSYGPGIVTVTNNAAFDVTLNISFSLHSGSGTLNVSDGGTARIGVDIILGSTQADAGTGTVNIGRRGTVIVDSIRCQSYGRGIVNFDGGTLKAGEEGKTLIQPSERMTVNVGANGGTIDNDGKNISIAQKMTGDGGMTFSGSGTTTISENQEYTGSTIVSEGTTLSVGGGVAFAGSVKFESGSKLNIANYTAGVTPFIAQSLILPEDEGIVSLTMNGGAFGEGSYVICSASGMAATNGEKFKFDTEGDLVGKWSVDGNMLILTIGEIDPNAWTGRGGDGKMSTVANWGGGKVPETGSNIDLSGIAVDTTIIADVNMTFGEVTMGTGVITFTGEFTATSFSDTSKVAVGANSTVTVLGDLEFGVDGNAYICYSVAQGGKFEVTGDIIITPGQTKSLLPCVLTVNEGVISAKGLITRNSKDLFALSWFQDNASAKWLIGENGICGTGTGAFFVGDKPGGQATIIAATNFVVSAHIISWRDLTFDTAGYTVTLGTNTLAKSGGISGNGNRNTEASGSVTVRGAGKVVANYNVNDLTTSSISQNNPFTVTDGATLVFKPGANIGTGLLTIKGGAALEIPESGIVTHNGNLSLETGSALAFNFTDRKTAPVLALAEGKAVTFTGEGEIAVKITGDVWPIGGDYVLTACGGFNAEDVSLADGAPKWAKDIRVNAEGNIVLTVRPKPTMIIVR